MCIHRIYKYFSPKTIVITVLCVICCQKPILAQSQHEQLFRLSSQYESIVIEKVIRADTVKLEGGELIKLIGIKAPPAPKRKKIERDSFGRVIRRKVSPLMTIEEKAFAFAEDLLLGKTVRIEFDAQNKDDDLETLAYVFLEDGTLVNAEFLRYGFADLRIMPPNTKYESLLREAYREAQKEKRGLRGE